MPATARASTFGFDIMRFAEDGLVHEHWGVVDMLAMMQQLGVIPDGAPA